MSSDLSWTIDQVSREKGINPQDIVHAIEDAILTASRKQFKNREDLMARFNKESGRVDIFGKKTVVEKVTNAEVEISTLDAQKLQTEAKEGDVMDILLSSRPLGRIEAQTAKQVIFQRVKEAERRKVFDEYSGRIGDLINGIIKNIEKGDIIVDLGTTDGILPKAMQSPVETFSRGDRLRAVVMKVHKFSNDPQVVLSRNDPRLLIKLFESEVPEIYDGTITIKAAVREAGDRAKIAVHAVDRQIDPVGACVGIKGTRVQSVINQLGGERIDIIEWSDDIVKLASNALKPAKVARVSNVDQREKRLEIIVDDDQLSLAIGKKGQNVRLASKLTTWKIDIRSQSEKQKEVKSASRLEAFRSKITTEPGLGEDAIHALNAGGFDSIEKIRQIQSAAEIPSLDPDTAQKLFEEIQQFAKSDVSA